MNPRLRRLAEIAVGKPAPRKGATGAKLPARPRVKPSWRAPGLRLRLIDAVALAAGGLLLLKLVGLATDDVGPGKTGFAGVIAHARTGYEPSDPAITGSVAPKESEAPKETSKEPPKPAPKAPPDTGNSAERAILEKLGARRDALQQRNRDLDTREQLIETAERKLESRIHDLKSLEDKADGGTARRAETEAAGLKAIVTMYETMKPKEAARVFDRLSLDVLVPVVVAMNPRKMAEVLAQMQPESAEKLTVALAMRARGTTPTPVAASGPAALPPNELPAIDAPR
jgi:flagellar motility protein MotE (MotC chaperone)